MDVHEKLSRWIFEQKITKREAARRLGTHPSNLTKWLAGQAPSLKSALIIECETEGHIKVNEWQ